MEQVFGYIIGLGAAVMMPIIFTILGVCIGIKFSKALKSGLLVGVGFVGLSVVTALLTSISHLSAQSFILPATISGGVSSPLLSATSLP